MGIALLRDKFVVMVALVQMRAVTIPAVLLDRSVLGVNVAIVIKLQVIHVVQSALVLNILTVVAVVIIGMELPVYVEGRTVLKTAVRVNKGIFFALLINYCRFDCQANGISLKMIFSLFERRRSI